MKSKEINRSLLDNYTTVIQSLDKLLTLNTTASNIDNDRNKTNSNIDSTTADWKTYENKQYNFSLKYPSTWNIKDSSIPFFSEMGLKIVLHMIKQHQTQLNMSLLTCLRKLDLV
jgi:ubiquitin-protein ligase